MSNEASPPARRPLRHGHNGLVNTVKMAAAIMAAVLILGGCENVLLGPHDVITAADRHRLAVMRGDVVFKSAVPGSEFSVVGEMWDKSNWRRGQMYATIYQTLSPTATMSPLPVQAFTGELLAGMEHRGWVVYYSACTFQSVYADTPPGEADGPTQWTNTVYAYRIYQGVSYWADTRAIINDRGDAQVRTGFASDVMVIMIAPEGSEPTSDLFADHPAALPLGSVCAAQAGEPPAPVAKGRPITVEVQSDDPYPPSAGSVRR